MKKYITTSFLVISLIISTLANAQSLNYLKFGIADKNPPKGLSVGEKAPVFIAYDYLGNEINLQKYIEKSPVVLIFYRGNWCPVCSKYLKYYTDSLKMISDKDVVVLFITAESADGAKKTVKKTKLPYTIVIDADQQIMKDYDVLFKVSTKYNKKIKTLLFSDIAKNNNEEIAHLPVPATFIIDKTGVIVWRQFDPDYKNRASTKDILEHLPHIK